MALEIRNLSKSFGEKKVLKDFSFNFSENGLYAISGISGIGKTTLLRIISGLDRNFSGEISGNNKVSFAFQEHRLFPQLSAIDNLIFAISDRKSEAVYEKCRNMLLNFGFCEADMNLLPSEMSGGMKQRVSLARAFLFDAPILLLDEPTKELDRENVESVLKIIKENARKRLVIIVSHNYSELKELNAHIIQL